MKGILKIYHPDETLKYHITNTYCKAVYSNKQHFLEVEIRTDDCLDHVEDDSLQYHFPQLSLHVFDFPIDTQNLEEHTFLISDDDENTFTEVDLYDNEDAYLYENELTFNTNDEEVLQLVWKGMISDFYTGLDSPVPFRLKCHFKHEDPEVGDE